MGLFSKNDATTKKIPTRKIISGVENNSNQESKPQSDMAAGAVLGVVSGLVSGVSSIWTSSNELKSKKAEAELLVKQIDLETAKGKNEVLVAALAVKKEEVARLEAQDKANANVRAIIYVGIFGVISFFAYLMFSPKKTVAPTVVQS